MANLIVPIDRPKAVTEINRESIANYHRTVHSLIPLLEEYAIEPFESGLKRMSGYSDTTPPINEVETEIKVDDIKFKVISTPTTKRPQYSLVYEQIIEYTNHLIEEHQRVGRIKDVSLIEGKPYVSLDLLLEKIRSIVESVKITKEGITQKIEYNERKIPLEILKASSIALDLSRTNDPTVSGSAKIYLMAKSIKSDYEKFKRDFENLVKERTGFSSQNIPDERKDIIITDIPECAILVKVIPIINISFSKIINQLIYETPKGKVTEKTGILIKAKEEREIDKYKELIVRKGGKQFVSLIEFSRLLQKLKEENMERSVRFNITTIIL
ncbi:MAG: hypothetical protein NZ903_01375 [Candidatus Micrarchaeota archaeon]|nr:hypothetical protein [Candidatus Micrarchaeota archaeon]